MFFCVYFTKGLFELKFFSSLMLNLRPNSECLMICEIKVYKELECKKKPKGLKWKRL